MKKLFNVLIGIFSAIILLLSIVFAVIEARLFFSGDWLVYDNAAAGFFKYLFRFILALSCGAYAVFEFINMKKNNKTISHFLFISNIGIVVMTMVMIFTASNMVGEIALLIATVTLLIKLLSFVLTKTENTKE